MAQESDSTPPSNQRGAGEGFVRDGRVCGQNKGGAKKLRVGYSGKDAFPSGKVRGLIGQIPYWCGSGNPRWIGLKFHSRERPKLQLDQALSLGLVTWLSKSDSMLACCSSLAEGGRKEG